MHWGKSTVSDQDHQQWRLVRLSWPCKSDVAYVGWPWSRRLGRKQKQPRDRNEFLLEVWSGPGCCFNSYSSTENGLAKRLLVLAWPKPEGGSQKVQNWGHRLWTGGQGEDAKVSQEHLVLEMTRTSLIVYNLVEVDRSYKESFRKGRCCGAWPWKNCCWKCRRGHRILTISTFSLKWLIGHHISIMGLHVAFLKPSTV